MTNDMPGTAAPRRKILIWLAVGAAALAVVVLVAVLLSRNGTSGAEPGPGETYTGSAPSTAGAGAEPSDPNTTPVPSVSIPEPTATGKPTAVPTQATRTTSAPLDGEVTSKDLSVRLAKLENVEGEAKGPGEIGGPAVRVTVEVDNDSDDEVSLAMALVNAYYGADKTPASPLSGPGVAPLAATVPAGTSVTGSYVFAVPADQRDRLTVEFSYSTDAPTVLFSGKA